MLYYGHLSFAVSVIYKKNLSLTHFELAVSLGLYYSVTWHSFCWNIYNVTVDVSNTTQEAVLSQASKQRATTSW
jgi:hypothetical protein